MRAVRMKRFAALAGLTLAVSLGAVACDDDDSGNAPTPTTATDAGTGAGGDSGVGTGTTGADLPTDGTDTSSATSTTGGTGTTGGAGTAGGAGGDRFTIDFAPLNGSGVSGSGTVTPGPNGRITVAFTADGLVPGQMHLQHIHEPDGQAAAIRCPTPDDDADGDGVVSLQESEAAYGPVRLDLTPYPNARGGSVSFERGYTVPQRFRPLTDGAVVLHGLEVDGAYDATVPVACGLVTPA